jgi:GT2 family glycosyltransferase
MQTEPQVTLIVVPRERFSCALESLDDLVRNTPPGCELIYVDGGSPPQVRDALAEAARGRCARWIPTDGFVSPNAARNLGLAAARGRYVVFVDNEVLVKPGWLDALVACAEETGAALVQPLCCIGEMADEIIHMVGGVLRIEDRNGRRVLVETHPFWDEPLARVPGRLRRGATDYVEFHCVLARRAVLDALGPLDEELLSVAEHLDLSLKVRDAGHGIWFEPAAHVTHLATRPLAPTDLPYFNLRWSDEWTDRSLRRLAARWNVDPRSPAIVGVARFAAIRRETFPQRASAAPSTR